MPEIKPIAHIVSDYKTKFGIPRQSGLAPDLDAQIIFEPEFAVAEAVRGLEGFSHVWLIWQFSENVTEEFSPTVRPPRLGGNTRMGVFATRSPFRPNSLGLSCVRLRGVEQRDGVGPVLTVSGADLMDGTPIFDIKPYVPYADCIPDAREGFATAPADALAVEIPPEMAKKIPAGKLAGIKEVLSCDPRPRYHTDPERVYGMDLGDLNIKFRVEVGTVTVTDVQTRRQDTRFSQHGPDGGLQS